MKANSQEYLDFLNLFSGADNACCDKIINDMKEGYPETAENSWAEFVHYDCLLNYCNTKHVQNYREYGIECVKKFIQATCFCQEHGAHGFLEPSRS